MSILHDGAADRRVPGGQIWTETKRRKEHVIGVHINSGSETEPVSMPDMCMGIMNGNILITGEFSLGVRMEKPVKNTSGVWWREKFRCPRLVRDVLVRCAEMSEGILELVRCKKDDSLTRCGMS
jgi:hypothetical protein